MSIEQAAERYEQYRSEGRLLRGAWTDEQDGKQRACWLAALSPEVERAERPGAARAAARAAAGAADRMIEAIFVAIETECARAGAQS